MAGSVNKVILIGNLGGDPEIKNFQNGGKMANIRLATSEHWKDRNTGERRERTEWHTIAVHAEGLVKVCEDFLKKGSKVYIEGQLETRKWQDQSGQDRYSTEIVLRPFGGTLQMLDPRRDGDGGQDRGQDGGRGQNSGGERDGGYGNGSGDYSGRGQGGNSGRSQGGNGGGGGHYAGGGRTDFDDEIPFAPCVL